MKDTGTVKLVATADVYRLLSACFYQPEDVFLEEDLFGQLATALSDCAPQLQAQGVQLGAAFAEAGTEALMLDYTRLFLGPFGILAKPYGSVYIDGEKVVMGDSTVNAKACYQQGGFSPAEDFKEMPDHVTIELEFLYLLCFHEAQALVAKDASAAAEQRALRRGFLQNHLGRWAGSFGLAMRAGARCEFYKILGELLESFIQQELQQG